MAARPGVAIYRRTGTWKNAHADIARLESHGKRLLPCRRRLACRPGEWLSRLGTLLRELLAQQVMELAAQSAH
jgi:hypothetical protein